MLQIAEVVTSMDKCVINRFETWNSLGILPGLVDVV
jgi:hypothetical protein